jgi:peptide/nickel transport system permease protein
MSKKVGQSFLSMFKRLFVREKIERNFLEEEAMRTPTKEIFLKLIHNKMAIIGFVIFLSILLFSFVGSQIWPLERLYTEMTNTNLPPSRNFLRMPSELEDKNIVKIVSGISFSVALTDDGNLTVWGTECNRLMEGISSFILEVPEEIQEANIVDVEAGMRFVIALDDEGNFYGWGHAGHGQTELPDDVRFMMDLWSMLDPSASDIVKIAASSMWSAVLTRDGNLYVWGSRSAVGTMIVPTAAQGRVVDFASGENNMILILDDGTLMPMGQRGNEFFDDVPTELTDGSTRVVEVVATNRNVVARDEHGVIHLWGSSIDGLNRKPDNMTLDSVIDISSGYKNFIAVKEDGEIFIWGAHELTQLNLPRHLRGPTDTVMVFADAHQFYAADEDGNILGAWGNRGYIWGSDQFGRDMFTRIIHGGRISLTVGVIAVIIATFIAIVIGLTAGFFGGWIDHVLMRIADIFDAIPFLPLVITLSYVLSHDVDEQTRLYMIMVILGVLGWTGLSRLIRAQLLVEREKDFVLAARALGIKQRGIMFKHILPNVFNFVIVSVTLSYAAFLLTEAGLSFLGFGVREPTPSWGNMLTSAQDSMVIRFFWWRWIIPGLFVITAALSINMVGDALREAMDPKSNER